MLLGPEERSPLKALDFGLAVPFEPDKLPRTDLGLEGVRRAPQRRSPLHASPVPPLPNANPQPAPFS
jgi:hypothetical protein